jgi:Spy/CpxP family protein refolding chaperone
MNVKSKTYFIIIITLLIGILLGILTSQFLIKDQIEKMITMGPQRHFIFMFKRIIDPTPEQEEKINKILEKYSKKLMELFLKNRGEFIKLQNSVRKELDPILTAEQKKRLEKSLNRRPRFLFPPFKGKKHSGPFIRNPEEDAI